MSLKILEVKIENLTFDPNNARKHSEKNLTAIANSLQEFGQRKPIVITSENVIVAGNGTVEAAKMLGLESVYAVRVPEDWGAEEIKAFAIADNRTAELAEWDLQKLSDQLSELEVAGFIEREELGFDAITVPEFEPAEEDVNPSLDERTNYECPNCRSEFQMVNGKPKAVG
jgi:ParB-like chromosome segregation protein Spo0J